MILMALSLTLASTVSGNDQEAKSYARVENCLRSFDIRAKARKLSPENYRIAIAGACMEEFEKARSLYSASMIMNPNQAYKIAQFNENFASLKATLTSKYVMGE